METLQQITARVLSIDISKVNNELLRKNTPEWDSFNHLILISEIEKILGVQLSISDIEAIKSFKDLSEIVAKKSGK